MKRNFMGFDGFTWFQGVVEDHNDPEQIGRVKVRCLGIHTEDKETLPTDDLPWAMVMMLLPLLHFHRLDNHLQDFSKVRGLWVGSEMVTVVKNQLLWGHFMVTLWKDLTQI